MLAHVIVVWCPAHESIVQEPTKRRVRHCELPRQADGPWAGQWSYYVYSEEEEQTIDSLALQVLVLELMRGDPEAYGGVPMLSVLD